MKPQIHKIIADIRIALSDAHNETYIRQLKNMERLLRAAIEPEVTMNSISYILEIASRKVVDEWPMDSEIGNRILVLKEASRKLAKKSKQIKRH